MLGVEALVLISQHVLNILVLEVLKMSQSCQHALESCGRYTKEQPVHHWVQIRWLIAGATENFPGAI